MLEFDLQVQGLCGNFNGDISDDYMTPNGELNMNITQFVSEWQTNAECSPAATTNYEEACSRSSQYEAYATSLCQMLTTGKMSFEIKLLCRKIIKGIEMSLNEHT